MTTLELARANLLHASMPSIRRYWEKDRAAGRTGLIYFVVDLDDVRAASLCGGDHDGMRVTKALARDDQVAWFEKAFPADPEVLRLLDTRHRGPAARAAADGKLVVVALAGDEGYAFIVEELVSIDR